MDGLRRVLLVGIVSIRRITSLYPPYAGCIKFNMQSGDINDNIKKTLAAAFLLMGFAASSASAVVITFDDLPSQEAISNGYAGLDWANFRALDGSTFSPNGYSNGTVSPHNVAFNLYGDPATISSSTGFNLVGGYFTGAWNDGLQISAVGAPGVAYSTSFIVNSNAPTYIAFHWNNITSVTFSSSGGSPAGYSGFGTHFALDNLEVAAAVPEPEEWAMMVASIPLLGWQIRRKQKRITR